MNKSKMSFGEKALTLLYIFFAFLICYCVGLRLPVGVKYIVSLIVAMVAGIMFFIKPHVPRMKQCLKFGIVLYIPFLIFWMWSLVIWILDFRSTDYIIRGSKNIVYMLTMTLYICASYYLFGQKAVYYNFYALCLANSVIILEVAGKTGFSALISDYITLISSFANVTGPAIGQLELHDIVHGFGLYLVYFIFHKDASRLSKFVHIFTALFFFSIAFKRIGFIGVAVASAIALLMKLFDETNRRRLMLIITIAVVFVSFVYIVSIKTGIYFTVCDALNVNLMGRDRILQSYNDYYQISPFFKGNGIRFVYAHGQETDGYSSLHNVILEHYIELGFVVWFIWMFYDFYFKSRIIARSYTFEAASMMFALTAYVFMTYATDNTYFYFMCGMVYRLLGMSWALEVADRKNLLEDDCECNAYAYENVNLNETRDIKGE